MFIRTQFNYDMNQAGDESGLDCSKEPSLAKQAFKDECDINTIVKRFGIGGEMPVNVRMPTYGDFTGVSDYREALHAIRDAEASFMAMPAAVRARFANDPGAFVDFCSNPANREEAEKLGLVEAAAAPSPKGGGGAAPAAPEGAA